MRTALARHAGDPKYSTAPIQKGTVRFQMDQVSDNTTSSAASLSSSSLSSLSSSSAATSSSASTAPVVIGAALSSSLSSGVRSQSLSSLSSASVASSSSRTQAQVITARSSSASLSNESRRPDTSGPVVASTPSTAYSRDMPSFYQISSGMTGMGRAAAMATSKAMEYGDDTDEKSRNETARGKYRCGRCGQPKVNHNCAYLDEQLVCSMASQTFQAEDIICNRTMQPFEGERLISFSGRKSIHTPFCLPINGGMSTTGASSSLVGGVGVTGAHDTRRSDATAQPKPQQQLNDRHQYPSQTGPQQQQNLTTGGYRGEPIQAKGAAYHAYMQALLSMSETERQAYYQVYYQHYYQQQQQQHHHYVVATGGVAAASNAAPDSSAGDQSSSGSVVKSEPGTGGGGSDGRGEGRDNGNTSKVTSTPATTSTPTPTPTPTPTQATNTAPVPQFFQLPNGQIYLAYSQPAALVLRDFAREGLSAVRPTTTSPPRGLVKGE
jgi:hypothetical protein